MFKFPKLKLFPAFLSKPVLPKKISLLLLTLLLTVFISIIIFFRFEINANINHLSAQFAYRYNSNKLINEVWKLSVNNPIFNNYIDSNPNTVDDLNAKYLDILADKETNYFSFVDRYDEERIDVLEFETVIVSDPEFPINTQYFTGGEDGFNRFLLSKIALYQPWNYREKIVNEELIEEVKPIEKNIYTGSKELSAIQAQLNEQIVASYPGVAGNPHIFEIVLSATEFSVTEAGTVNIGSGKVLYDGCNYFIQLPILYSVDSHIYELSNDDRIPEYSCNETVYNSSPVEIAVCSDDCIYFPIGKSTRLRKDYTPTVSDLGALGYPGLFIDQRAYSDLVEMINALNAAGINSHFTSTYRSYDNQVNTFNSWVQGEMARGYSYSQSVINANVYSAFPGFSEHQLGTAIDINFAGCASFEGYCSGNDSIWNWLANNSWKYGFVLSYPDGTQDITGYTYEPWHYRWIGKDLASEFIQSDKIVPEVWLRERLKNQL